MSCSRWRAASPIGLLALLAASPAYADLAAELNARLDQTKSRFSAQVVDAATGEVLYARGADQRLVPASNMKIMTTAAALTLLGEDYVHETRMLVTAAPEDGVVHGQLVVVGRGDPTISRRFDPEPLLSDWAAELQRLGVKRIEGDLIVDDRAFPDEHLHPSWEAGDPEHWYGAEVAALNLNDNCVDVSVAGGEQVTVTSHPDTRYVSFDVRAALIPTRKGHSFSLTRTGDDKRTIRVTGKVWRKAGPYESSVPVHEPALFFGSVLCEQLEALGITLTGQVRRAQPDEQLDGLTVHLRRAPLPRTLATCDKRSLNLYAECLLKTLGLEKGRAGTWPDGVRVVTSWAQEQGVAAEDMCMLDGSGLSRQDGLTARALVTVLRAMARGPHAEAFRDCLARPGEEGTLRRRFKTLPPGVELWGKTGTLRDVSALSGYLRKGQRTLVFSLIGNGGSGGKIRRALDAAIQILAEHLSG